MSLIMKKNKAYTTLARVDNFFKNPLEKQFK